MSVRPSINPVMSSFSPANLQRDRQKQIRAPSRRPI
jgi:hypothetical protein